MGLGLGLALALGLGLGCHPTPNQVFNSPEAAARLANTRAASEVAALHNFFALLSSDPDRVTYGLKPVAAAAERGAIQVLLLADSLLRAQHVARRRTYVELVNTVKTLGTLTLTLTLIFTLTLTLTLTLTPTLTLTLTPTPTANP